MNSKMTEAQAITEARLMFDWTPESGPSLTVKWCNDGHEGPGWYAWETEYPEEGSVCLSASDI
jgi:hypothetical protein